MRICFTALTRRFAVVRGALEGRRRGVEEGALLKEHDVTLLQRAIFFPVETRSFSHWCVTLFQGCCFMRVSVTKASQL